jgi:hypothetical protein
LQQTQDPRSEGINLGGLNAFAAGAIGDAFMQLSAKSADPDGQNGKRKSLFAIAKVSAVLGLFRHVVELESLEYLTSVENRLDASIGEGQLG